MVKVEKEKRHIIEPFQVAQMIENASTIKDKSIIALYYITGIRAKEAFTIRKEDIWQDDKYLYIRIQREKSAKKKILPLISILSISLDTHFLKYILDHWASINDGNIVWDYALRPETARVYVWKMIKKLNPDIWIHLFRHTRAESFRSKGITDSELMAWFGWVDARTPSHYTHPDENTIKKLGSMIE